MRNLFRKRALSQLTLRRVGSAVAALGVLIMTYLWYLGSSGGTGVCDFGAEFSCSLVNQSVYADLLGIPVSFLGILYFLGVAMLLLLPNLKSRFTWVLLVTVFSLIFGVYLSMIEFFVLESICLFCETSKVLMLVLAGIAVRAIRMGKEVVPFEWLIWVAALGVVFSFGAWTVQHVPDYEFDAPSEGISVVVEPEPPVARCASENGNGSVQCANGNVWCGGTCRTEPECPSPTVRLDCGSCTCVCPDGTLSCLSGGKASPETPPINEPYTEARYLAAVAEGRPILLQFTGEQCRTCDEVDVQLSRIVADAGVPIAAFTVDTDVHPNLADMHVIGDTFPVVFVNTGGIEVARLVAPVSDGTLRALVQDIYYN